MWGTSSPDDKLTGDLGNVIETVKIGGRGSDRLMARKLSPSNFGLLQQYRHEMRVPRDPRYACYRMSSGHNPVAAFCPGLTPSRHAQREICAVHKLTVEPHFARFDFVI
jgi:hypothetical protein